VIEPFSEAARMALAPPWTAACATALANVPIASAPAATMTNLNLSMSFSPPLFSLRISRPEIQAAAYPIDRFCMRPECAIHVVVGLVSLCWRSSFAFVSPPIEIVMLCQEKDQVCIAAKLVPGLPLRAAVPAPFSAILASHC
jgi:hypothetical protein